MAANSTGMVMVLMGVGYSWRCDDDFRRHSNPFKPGQSVKLHKVLIVILYSPAQALILSTFTPTLASRLTAPRLVCLAAVLFVPCNLSTPCSVK